MADTTSPADDFLASFRETSKTTTHEEWRALDRQCLLLVEQRVRHMIETYAATKKTAFDALLETDIGQSLIEAGEIIEHELSVLDGLAEHAAFIAECR